MDRKNAVWITGASSGIGRAVAELLSQHDYRLILSSRNKQNLSKLQEDIAGGGKSIILPLDISNSGSIENSIKAIGKDDNIQCLINNAGVTSFQSAESDSIEEIENIISTNLLGSIHMIKAVLPGMIAQKSGLIINILSVAALKVFTNSSAYAASKAGLLAYTNVLREEVREHNIRIVNILPGATKTAIWPAKTLNEFSHRMMSPSEIASVVLNVIETNGTMVQEEIVLRPLGGDL